MIYDIAMCLFYVAVMIFVMHAFGNRLIKSTCFAKNFIYGYVLYIVLCSLIGICTQFFSLPWKLYEWSMSIIFILVTVFSFYKREWKFSLDALKKHYKEYGLYNGMAAILVCLGLIYIYYQWLNNHIDDAWYLGKVKMVPEVDNMSTLYYPTGFTYPADYVRMVNTFEIELAFFSHIMHISPSVFVKVGQSFLMYFIILNVFHLLYQKLLYKNLSIDQYFISVIMLAMLIFGWYHELLAGKEVLYLHDSWQFNTAIWYGSSTVRTMSLVLLLYPFMDNVQFSLKKGVYYVLTCVFLMTRASQAIPAIYLATAAYICYQMLIQAQKRKQIYGFIVVILIAMAVIPMSETCVIMQDVIWMVLKNNVTSILLMLTVLMIALSFQLKNNTIQRWNIWLIIMAILMFMPRINTLFLRFCIYDFVVARTTTLYFFTLVGTGFCYMGYFLYQLLGNGKKLYLLYGCMSLYLICVPVLYIQQIYGVKHAVSVLLQNPKLIPQSTLDLSKELETYQQEIKEDLYILAPAVVSLDGTVHSFAAMLRYEAPHIYVVGAVPRYSGMLENNKFYGYTQREQDVFEYFNNGTDMDVEKMNALFQSYPINCLIVTNLQAKQMAMRKLGFQEVFDFDLKQGNTYYVLKK